MNPAIGDDDDGDANVMVMMIMISILCSDQDFWKKYVLQSLRSFWLSKKKF